MVLLALFSSGFYLANNFKQNHGSDASTSRGITARIRTDHYFPGSVVRTLQRCWFTSLWPRCWRNGAARPKVRSKKPAPISPQPKRALPSTSSACGKPAWQFSRAQEARRQQALKSRAEAVAQARAKAQAQVEQARAAMEKDKVAAQEISASRKWQDGRRDHASSPAAWKRIGSDGWCAMRLRSVCKCCVRRPSRIVVVCTRFATLLSVALTARTRHSRGSSVAFLQAVQPSSFSSTGTGEGKPGGGRRRRKRPIQAITLPSDGFQSSRA